MAEYHVLSRGNVDRCSRMENSPDRVELLTGNPHSVRNAFFATKTETIY